MCINKRRDLYFKKFITYDMQRWMWEDVVEYLKVQRAFATKSCPPCRFISNVSRSDRHT